MTTLAVSPNKKHTGAYYTDAKVAAFLAQWAIRRPTDRVLDPSFGGGVFLHAAEQCISDLGGDPANTIFGVEMDPATREDTAARLEPAVEKENLWLADFFDIEPQNFDAVIGNPPFVRYQTFTGTSREQSLKRASDQGVRLPRLASSWAAFVIHSVAMLRPGGRLAMVLPMEMWHASYALPVVNHLKDKFEHLQLITFRQRLFTDISQDTVLLLADGCDRGPAKLHWRDLDSPDDLAGLCKDQRVQNSQPIDIDSLANGSRRLIEEFVSPRALEIYNDLLSHPSVRTIGEVAQVGIGYVSGNNRFFHLSRSEAREHNIPKEYLLPAVCKGRAFSGLQFSKPDWDSAEQNGDAAYLLYLPPSALSQELPQSVKSYLESGVHQGVHNAYKCRVRTPWYAVPHVYQPEAFLTYMSGRYPALVVNTGGFVSPNNLHTIRLLEHAPVTPRQLALGWFSSLTRLSVELQGHAMGGGMLKLEPREAARVAIPMPERLINTDFSAMDALARAGDPSELTNRIDTMLLGDLGLTQNDCRLLNNAAEQLMQRRYAGGRRR